MERASSAPSVEENGGETLSCGGCLKMKLPWTKRRDNYMKHKTDGCNITATLCSPSKKPKPRGSFRYDPLSYAQNFDDGGLKDDNGDYYSRGFSSRFVVPPATTKSTVAQTPGKSLIDDRRGEEEEKGPDGFRSLSCELYPVRAVGTITRRVRVDMSSSAGLGYPPYLFHPKKKKNGIILATL